MNQKYLSLLFLTSLLMIGCSIKSEDGQNDSDLEGFIESEKIVSETEAGEFVLRLVSEKARYKLGEKVDVRGKLKYIGENAEIEISHSESPFFFEVIEVNRGVEIPYFLNEVLEMTLLKNNEWYEEEFHKRIDNHAADEYDEFFQIFMVEEGFPVGEYEIELRADFLTSAGEESESHNYNTSIVIDVKE
ncbi:hypothetical protein ACM26V_22950 [Salipaludibacillus sp. HK11]|uniref:hypothetical protein n=1 Tax=Salipaludibacillus sp. HK11 TaxID=3394320 RepID=UPI0039FCBC0A